MVPLLNIRNSALKHVKASTVFIDSPFGYSVDKLWDLPKHVWKEDYWLEILKSLEKRMQESGLLVVFGDLFKVYPPLHAAITHWNSDHGKKWIAVPPLFYNKRNHTNKGTGPYANSVELAFLYYWSSVPRIGKLPYELNGNLIEGNKTGDLLHGLADYHNPCQKPNVLLKLLLENHAEEKTLVIDLTAGSFTSFLAVLQLTKETFWVGSDTHPEAGKNWDFFTSTSFLVGHPSYNNWIAGKSLLFTILKPFSLPRRFPPVE